MILTGRKVSAEEAKEMGLIDRLVPAGAELEEALAVAATIASFPQGTMRRDRLCVYRGLGRPLEDGLALEAVAARAGMGEAAAGAERFAAGEGRSGMGLEGPIA